MRIISLRRTSFADMYHMIVGLDFWLFVYVFISCHTDSYFISLADKSKRKISWMYLVYCSREYY
jgi:hypothetical protein